MTTQEIFDSLVDAMGMDNGVTFKPTRMQSELGKDAIMVMLLAGFKFTEEMIQELVAGEEAGDGLPNVPRCSGLRALHHVLNDIFDGPIAEDN